MFGCPRAHLERSRKVSILIPAKPALFGNFGSRSAKNYFTTPTRFATLVVVPPGPPVCATPWHVSVQEFVAWL